MQHHGEFELHLLESGISGQLLYLLPHVHTLFELHLLESGISGNFIQVKPSTNYV